MQGIVEIRKTSIKHLFERINFQKWSPDLMLNLDLSNLFLHQNTSSWWWLDQEINKFYPFTQFDSHQANLEQIISTPATKNKDTGRQSWRQWVLHILITKTSSNSQLPAISLFVASALKIFLSDFHDTFSLLQCRRQLLFKCLHKMWRSSRRKDERQSCNYFAMILHQLVT